MKKIGLLIIVFTLIIAPLNTAKASTFPDIVGREYEEAVNYLVNKNVVSGYSDGTYRPDALVKRSEFSKLVAEAFDLVDNNQQTVSFSDVKNHWAEPYINIVSKNELVKGYPDNTFLPENQISYAEIFTILVRAIGEESKIDINNSWPENYINLANTLGLVEKLNIQNYSNPATRGDVAIAIFNSLNQKPEVVKKLPSITFSETKLELTDSAYLIVTLNNPPAAEFHLYFSVKDSSIVEAAWGDWFLNMIPLTVTAKGNGTTSIEVHLEEDPTIRASIEVVANKPKPKYNSGITFDQLARRPDDYTGKYVQFKGKVIQVMEDNSSTSLRIVVDDDYDKVILATLYSDILDERVLEKDTVVIKGVSAGLFTYESIFGASITVPSIIVDEIEIK